MIEEKHVSLIVSKLLKENGFNEPCHYFYENEKIFHDLDKYFPDGVRNSDFNSSYKGGTLLYTAPTYQIALSWLMASNIHIGVYPCSKDYPVEGKTPEIVYQCTAINANEPFHLIKDDYLMDSINGVFNSEYFDTPEEALDNAIQYSLKNFFTKHD